MREDGRLPPPEFPFGNRIPAWREDVLEAHDRSVVAAGQPQADLPNYAVANLLRAGR
jgi:hypothetical protein